jgi:hypothetical protein
MVDFTSILAFFFNSFYFTGGMRRARGIARRSRSARGKKGVKRIHDSKLLLSGQEERIYRVQRKVF